jgi:hypothetical protein
MFLGVKRQADHKADNFTAIFEPFLWIIWEF